MDLRRNDQYLMDFQKRAKNYEEDSKWVKDNIINDVPYKFLSSKDSLGNILDVGGGTGYLLYYLAKRMPFSKITIVDVSENMLQIAKSRMPHAQTVNKSIEEYCKVDLQEFDTIIARQILHYVDDVELIISLLKRKLKESGLLYVGQFVVPDNESDIWHGELIKKISPSRKRSFTQDNFLNIFLKDKLNILRFETIDYEENLRDFYKRRYNTYISYEELYNNSIRDLNDNVKEKLSVKITENNIFFTVQFCHLLICK